MVQPCFPDKHEGPSGSPSTHRKARCGNASDPNSGEAEMDKSLELTGQPV